MRTIAIQLEISEAASSWRVLMHSLKRVFTGRTAVVNEEGDACGVEFQQALSCPAAWRSQASDAST